MIDDYKIKKASRMYADEVFESRKYDENHLQPHHIAFIEGNAAGFEAGAKWAVNEFIKDLWHPASEVPRNDNGKVFAFSKEIGHRKLYDMNAMLDETTCNTYQDMWKKEVNAFRWSDWIFIEELIDLIKKGGKK